MEKFRRAHIPNAKLCRVKVYGAKSRRVKVCGVKICGSDLQVRQLSWRRAGLLSPAGSGVESLSENFEFRTPAAKQVAEKTLNLSFRAQRGISLWFECKEREIPRHEAHLGMTRF